MASCSFTIGMPLASTTARIRATATLFGTSKQSIHDAVAFFYLGGVAHKLARKLVNSGVVHSCLIMERPERVKWKMANR